MHQERPEPKIKTKRTYLGNIAFRRDLKSLSLIPSRRRGCSSLEPSNAISGVGIWNIPLKTSDVRSNGARLTLKRVFSTFSGYYSMIFLRDQIAHLKDHIRVAKRPVNLGRGRRVPHCIGTISNIHLRVFSSSGYRCPRLLASARRD